MKKQAMEIALQAIEKNMPQPLVREELCKTNIGNSNGKLIVVAVGKAAWTMSSEAEKVLNNKITQGLVITKYGHSMGDIPGFEIFEGGHPLLDENGVLATQKVLEATRNLNKEDEVLFLLSGGGSALFEVPVISLVEMEKITWQLLKNGANIIEINQVRKRLSLVKGGRFAAWCSPAKVTTLVLSDIIGNPVDMIASGPTAVDQSTCCQAYEVIRKYNISLSKGAFAALGKETPKKLYNSHIMVIGSVEKLCYEAKIACERLGYESQILTTCLECQAKEAGSFLAAIALHYQHTKKPLAFIVGGETLVEVKGAGKGGRNQELALAAAPILRSCKSTALFSIGSDGTDGPTDAAGGYVDQRTALALEEKGLRVETLLADNNAYYGLQAVNGLMVTGPTGTNVNDVAVVLIKR